MLIAQEADVPWSSVLTFVLILIGISSAVLFIFVRFLKIVERYDRTGSFRKNPGEDKIKKKD